MNPNVGLGLTNIVAALVIIVVSVPLVKHKVKMNRLYGIRLPKAFESSANWYRINAYGGRQLIVWQIPVLLAGVVCLFIPMQTMQQAASSLLLGVGPLVVCNAIALVRIVRYAKRL